MNRFPIYIPSKGRPTAPTAKLISDSACVIIEQQDAADYRKSFPKARIIVLPESNRGIAYVRNFILNEARRSGAEWFWMLDDDITGFYEVAAKRCVRASPLSVLAGAESVFSKRPNTAQAALEYRQFAWASEKGYSLNGYCDVAVCINTKRSAMANYDSSVTLKEDRDFSMQLLSQGYETFRTARFAFSAPKNGTNEGGLKSVYASLNAEANAVAAMVSKWGVGLCNDHTKPDGRRDVKINWRAFNRGAMSEP
jgi:glycosyltransferase involved in cell wall biosynthesis